MLLAFWTCLYSVLPADAEYAAARFERSRLVHPKLFEILDNPRYELEATAFDWYSYHLKILENAPAHIMSADFGHQILINDGSGTDDWSGRQFPLIIPIHLGIAGKSVGHWTTAVVDNMSGKLQLYYFDYLMTALPDHVFQRLENYISRKLEIRKEKPSFFRRKKTSVFDEIFVFKNQHQRDSYSCGVFSLYTMQLFAFKGDVASLNYIFNQLNSMNRLSISDKRQEYLNLLLVDQNSGVIEVG